MRILCVSDVVVKELLAAAAPPLPGIELVLACGDLPPEYLAALRHRYDVPLYYVLGNHDHRYGESPPGGCIAINRRLVKVGKLRIVGFSGSRWYNGGINQYTDQQMAGFVRRMRFTLWRHGGVDLVLTHAPPRYINDAEDLCHRGFRTFADFIARYRPSYFIHGHIHALFDSDAARISTVNSTKVVNSYGYYVLET